MLGRAAQTFFYKEDGAPFKEVTFWSEEEVASEVTRFLESNIQQSSLSRIEGTNQMRLVVDGTLKDISSSLSSLVAGLNESPTITQAVFLLPWAFNLGILAKLQHVDTLMLSECNLTYQQISKFCHVPGKGLKNLKVLHLGSNELTDESVETLKETGLLGRLEKLSLYDNYISEKSEKILVPLQQKGLKVDVDDINYSMWAGM